MEMPRTPAYAIDQFVAVWHKRGIVQSSNPSYDGRTDSRGWVYGIGVMDDKGDVVDWLSAPEDEVRSWVGPAK